MLLERIRCGWFEHGDMEYQVNGPHGIRKMECERLQTGLDNYLIWSEILFREFFRWTCHSEIL